LQVKGNQKILHEQVQANTSQESSCIDSHRETARHGGRIETRKTFVYRDVSGISSEWIEVKRLIRIERYVSKKGGQTHETAYFISDVRSNKARFFARHIRNHWSIENRLHWIKDVILNEDGSRTAGGMAAENISVIRNIAINLFRLNGYTSIKYAIELFTNDFKKLLTLISYKLDKYKIT
jgi:predicted transposase YbfD/YdcC